jgi:hypothetical protein
MTKLHDFTLRRPTWRHHPAVRSGDQLTRGERAADRLRNGMGSWGFVKREDQISSELARHDYEADLEASIIVREIRALTLEIHPHTVETPRPDTPEEEPPFGG